MKERGRGREGHGEVEESRGGMCSCRDQPVRLSGCRTLGQPKVLELYANYRGRDRIDGWWSQGRVWMRRLDAIQSMLGQRVRVVQLLHPGGSSFPRDAWINPPQLRDLRVIERAAVPFAQHVTGSPHFLGDKTQLGRCPSMS